MSYMNLKIWSARGPLGINLQRHPLSRKRDITPPSPKPRPLSPRLLQNLM